MANIAFYGSHNGGIAIENNGQYHVIEFERFFNIKNIGLAQYRPLKHREEAIVAVLDYIENKLGFKPPFENLIHGQTECAFDDQVVSYKDYIPANNVFEGYHHLAHGSGSFYQSNFAKALVFSFDGGGNDGYFNVFLADRDKGLSYINKTNPTEHTSYNIDFGFPYMSFAHFCNDIKQEWLSTGNLVYSGKIMGLCNYGHINYDWLPYFREYYYSHPEGHNYIEKLNQIIGKNCQLTFDENKRFKGDLAYNIAATSQKAFEDCFFAIAKVFIDRYKKLPVVLTGGCGLNILLNTKFKEMYPDKELFIAPNTSDCGIALGYLATFLKPKKPIDITYGGIEILDEITYPAWVESTDAEPVNLRHLANQISKGKIYGVIRGRSEHGPRALGNRSIICNPAFPEMKDILNKKIKHREWYRPFAPIVRLKDVSKYFEWEGESRHMMFCPTVRSTWRKLLSSITHVDNTARVQTVTRDQNPWIYDLLTELDDISGVGVVLNTSFNIAGKPIVNTIADAMKLYENSQMDGLVINDFYCKKH